MRSGDLKTIVTIYRKTEITSEYGEKSFVYNKYKVTRGNVNKLPRNRADIDSKATYMMDLSITIWAYVDINEDDVVKVNGNKYFVNKINDDLDRNFKTLDLIDIDDTTVVTDEDAPKDMYSITTASNFDYMGYTTGSTRDYEGTQITISATAFSGYIFDHWDDGNTDNPRTIEIVRNAKYTAIFKAYTPDTPAGRVISKMQEEQPALYDALTMWFDPKMEGITQADIANWFDYPEWYGVKDQWNALSYKKALTNLSGKPGDMWMQSLDPDLPTPTIMEDGRLKMNDAKCTLILDRLATNQEMDTIFWYMDYEVPEGFMENSNRSTISFYPWVFGNYLYLIYDNGSTGVSGVTKGLSYNFGGTNNTREDGLYQLPASFGYYMSATLNTITISSASGDNLKYVKSVIPNHPCYTTRRKNSSTSTYFDKRRTCCYYKADEIQIYDRSISGNTTRNANTLGNLPAHFGICDRRSDYQVNPDSSLYKPAGDCILGWFISFNRPLTDEEIAWVEDNMYSTKLEDIPYRPFVI